MKNFKVTEEKQGDVILLKVQGYLNDLEATREKTLNVCFTALSPMNEELFEMVGLKKYAVTYSANPEALEFLRRL
jgi:anti-anti-sigma regulatory factor